ncbi:MAG: hypothetical protein JWO46_3326 [Nocardioidaceae bacterium]|nr:hypothetical protein [Nocardioidaceae bacterium]
MQIQGWHPDPFGRHGERFYDGNRWTPYVKDGDQHATDEPIGAMAQVPVAPGAMARRSLFTEPVLVVRQRAKLVELVDEYDVLDAAGQPVGSVREVGQGAGRKTLRALTTFDTLLTHRLEVRDADGSLALALTRRAPNGRRNGTVVVNDGMGAEVGRFEQQWRLGKTRFGLQRGDGTPLGYLSAESWWDWNFRVTDLADREVATITKSWRGLAVELFTTADAYVVRVVEQVPEPLRTLTVAAALAVDLVRKQADGNGIDSVGAVGITAGVLKSLLD